MLLVVDAGNTNVVFAVHDGSSWRGIWRIATEPQRTSDEYAVWLLTLLSFVGLKPAQINRAVIGTVVAEVSIGLRGGIGRLVIEYAQAAGGDPAKPWAPIIGAIVLGYLKLLLGQQTLIDNSLVLGAILILVVLLLPSGLLPALARWRARRDQASVSRRQASSTRRRRGHRGEGP